MDISYKYPSKDSHSVDPPLYQSSAFFRGRSLGIRVRSNQPGLDTYGVGGE